MAGAILVRAGGAVLKVLVAAALLAPSGVSAGPPRDLVINNLRFTTQSFNLDSGLRVVLDEDHSRPLVAVAVVIDSGFRQDPPGKEGLAHLVEHLSFRVCHDGESTVAARFTAAGVGLRNGETGSDITVYWSVGPKEALGDMLTIEGLRLASPLVGVDATSFAVERDVVRNELLGRGENSELTEASNRLRALLFPPDHPYARSRNGPEAVLSLLTLEDARAFTVAYYQPSRVTIAVAGDIDGDGLTKLIATRLPKSLLVPPEGSPPVPPNLRPVLTNPPAPPPQAKIERVTSAGVEHPTLFIGWTLPPGYDGQGFLQSIAAGVIELLQVSKIDDGDLQAIRTRISRGRLGTTLLAVVTLKVGVHPEATAARVVDAVVRAFDFPARPSAQAGAVLSIMMSRMKAVTLLQTAAEGEVLQTRAQWRGQGFHVTGDTNVMSRQAEELKNFSLPVLREYAERWLTRDRARTVFIDTWGASPTALTDEDGAAEAGAGTNPATLDPRPDASPPGAWRVPFRGAAVTPLSFQLGNGLAVTLLPRKGSPLSSATIAVRGGEATATPFGVHALAMMSRQVTFDHGSAWLVGGSLTTSSNRDTTFFSAMAGNGNLENVLGNLADAVRSRRVRIDAVDRFLDKGLSAYTQALDQPGRRSSQDLWGKVLEGSAYARVPTAFDLHELNAAAAQEWLTRALTPRNAVLAIAGDFDPREAEALVRSLFGDWRSEAAPAEVQLPLKPEPETAPLRVVRSGRPGDKQTRLHFACAVQQNGPVDVAAMEILEDRLTGRIHAAARSALGGSYGFSGRALIYRTLTALDVEGSVDPKSLAQVSALLRKEVEEMSSLHLSEAQLAPVRRHLAAEINVAYQRSTRLATDAAWMMAAGIPVARLIAPADFYLAPSTDDVARVAAACRRSGVLSFAGDPAVVERATETAPK